MHNPETATIMAEWRGFYAGETVSAFSSLEVGHWGLAMIHHDLLHVGPPALQFEHSAA
jgi:hypothetical protein